MKVNYALKNKTFAFDVKVYITKLSYINLSLFGNNAAFFQSSGMWNTYVPCVQNDPTILYQNQVVFCRVLFLFYTVFPASRLATGKQIHI